MAFQKDDLVIIRVKEHERPILGTVLIIQGDSLLSVIPNHTKHYLSEEPSVYFAGVDFVDFKKVTFEEGLFAQNLTPSVSESSPRNKGSMDKYFIDLEAYEESFCCNECSNDRKSEFTYQRSVSNGEVWLCKFCKSEILPTHKPNEDNY
jgi:hypothetical protein